MIIIHHYHHLQLKDLPDADAAGIGFGNKSDPYVIVRSYNQTIGFRCKFDRVSSKDLYFQLYFHLDNVNDRVSGEEQNLCLCMYLYTHFSCSMLALSMIGSFMRSRICVCICICICKNTFNAPC